MIGWARWGRAGRDIALIAAGLMAVSFLPPDTSLLERQEAGYLRYCVGDAAGALIQDAASGGAGPERALMENATADLGLDLRVVEVANIARSFNPADWNISRGQCDVLGGGVADSAANRGFVTLIATGQKIGLDWIGPYEQLTKGAEVGVFMGSAGLDRLRLSGWLRAESLRARPLADARALEAWLAQGGVAIASTLTPTRADLPRAPLPEPAGEVLNLAIGMWRGDTTLTRALRQALERHRDDAEIRANDPQ